MMTKEFLLTSRPGSRGTSFNLHRSKLKPQFFDNFYGVESEEGRLTSVGNLEIMTTSVSGPMGSSKHDLVFGKVK